MDLRHCILGQISTPGHLAVEFQALRMEEEKLQVSIAVLCALTSLEIIF